MANSIESTKARKRYQRLNWVFWFSIAGIFLGPVAALILSAILFKAFGSDVSAPVGLTAPLWSVAAIAVALLVRGARKAARRSRDLSRLAESTGLEFHYKSDGQSFEFLRDISFMADPLDAKGINILEGKPGGRNMVAIDYRYSYFYGAVSVVGEQTIVAFPKSMPKDFEFSITPISLADRILDRLTTSGSPIRTSHLPQFENQFRVFAENPDSAVRILRPELADIFLQDLKLTLVVENGHVLVFRQLTYVPANEYQEFIRKALQIATLLQPRR